jgi:hypothetical protein
MKTTDERKAELAQLLRAASNQIPVDSEMLDAERMVGQPDLWGVVAAKLIDIIEETVKQR